MRLRCVYVDGKPLPGVYVALLREGFARVMLIIGYEYYTFAFKEEAEEYLRRRFGIENFQVLPCPK
jgi:hypothetical protein